MEDDDTSLIIMDLGSYMIKAGFTGDSSPRACFPSIMGQLRHTDHKTSGDLLIGDEAQLRRGTLKSQWRQIENGFVQHWEHMGPMFKHIFYEELRVDPAEHPVMVSEKPLTPSFHREKLVEMLFEEFNVPKLSVGIDAVMQLYCSGRRSGIVVDCGYGTSHVTPIYEGHVLPHAVVQSSSITGKVLTENMWDWLLEDKAFNLAIDRTAGSLEILEDIKTRLGHVPPSADVLKQNPIDDIQVPQKSYELPDGNEIFVRLSIAKVGEAIFSPDKLLRNHEGAAGLHYLVYKALNLCPPQLSDLSNHIVLAGGTTMFPELANRLQQSVRDLCGKDRTVRVMAPPERKYSVWIGQSLLTSLSTFKSWWFTKEMYDEYGVQYVHDFIPRLD